MTNHLHNVILILSEQESISLHDVVNALFNYVHRYQAIFERMHKIRSEAPLQVGDQTFRRRDFSNEDTYREIELLLQKFNDYLIKFDRELHKIQHHPEYTQELSDRLLKAIEHYIQSLRKIYQGKSTSFASVLNDILALDNLFLQKLETTEVVTTQSMSIDKTSIDTSINEDQKFVYIRIFHKQMPTLITGIGDFAWVKPLLESVCQAEKHGFGVYENEQDVEKSLKDEHYGYVKVKINKNQDITHQRPEKICPMVGCPLLTVEHIELNDIMQLTHENKQYDIKNGVLYRK